MRYPPEQKKQTAANMLAAAEREFRLGGYSGVGVDGLARQAGATSGAFYKHFRSKAAAFAAAVSTGLEDYRRHIEKFQADRGLDWLIALTDYYFSRGHLADLAGSCVVPSLTGDVARSSEQVRALYQQGIERVAAMVASGLSHLPTSERKHRAWVILGMLAGGVTLARAVRDQAVAEEIALAMREAVLAIGRAPAIGREPRRRKGKPAATS